MHPSVKYELSDLEKMAIHPEFMPGLFGDIQVAQEVERIKQTMVHRVFSFEDERHLERYVQQHQRATVLLMDKIGSLKGNSSSEAFYRQLYSSLEGLLRFIEKHFTRYFDQDAKAPEEYIALARVDAEEHIGKLEKEMLARKVDLPLVEAVLHCLRKVSEKGDRSEITYRRVLYATEVREEISQVLQRSIETDDINEEIRMAINYLNYNSIKVFAYHAKYFDAILQSDDSRTEKVERLSYALKKINQSQVKPGVFYDKDRPSLKDQLCCYLKEEIDYLEKLSHGSGPKGTDAFLGFKLKLEISVSQLAYLVRVFVDTQVVQNKNITEVLKFLAQYTITKRSESISYTSFRVKFYNIEIGTKEAVRNMLFTMIRYIDKN